MSDALLEGITEGERLRLAGAGAWTAIQARRLEAMIDRHLRSRAPIKRVDIDMSRVERLDTYGALAARAAGTRLRRARRGHQRCLA